MYLIGLLLVFGLLGVFAMENGGAQDFTFLGYIWHFPGWVPAAVGVTLVTLLLVLHMTHAGLRHGLHRVGYQRTVDQHRALIADLRAENASLREELAALRARGRQAQVAAAPTPRDRAAALLSRLSGG